MKMAQLFLFLEHPFPSQSPNQPKLKRITSEGIGGLIPPMLPNSLSKPGVLT